MASELKSCPFCGSNFNIGQEPHDNHPVAGMFYIFHEYGPIGSAARNCRLDIRGHFNTEKEAEDFWNTRPAPAATDTGLETVGYMAQTRMGWIPSCASSGGEAVVTRSQAEELLAAETKLKQHWKDEAERFRIEFEKAAYEYLLAKARAEKAEADNAAKDAQLVQITGERDTAVKLLAEACETPDIAALLAAKDARIKELDQKFATRTRTAQTYRDFAYQQRRKAEALVAKLAAAEKALEPFAAVLDDYDPDWEDDDVTAVLVVGSVTHYGITLGDFRKTRAVLGGKPS